MSTTVRLYLRGGASFRFRKERPPPRMGSLLREDRRYNKYLLLDLLDVHLTELAVEGQPYPRAVLEAQETRFLIFGIRIGLTAVP